ncbi:sugar transferase [Phreatobacter sp.]|uniref:sugar transferase n=1 Tax=Phreatobacter sp. TaxID=1966341 RepID=UPI003F6FAF51
MSKAVPSQVFALAFEAAPTALPVQRSMVGSAAKRVADVTLSLVALAFLWPLMVAIALAIRSSDGGPAIFAQTRVGRHGRPFTCLKFRSMVLDAEKVLADQLARDPQSMREWQANQKLVNDPRITGLGRFLRKSSLDELPQLINILLGQMSIVGPRPIVPAEIDRYGESFAHCFSVRPGLTGLWQVSGRSDCNYQTRVALDSRYAATQSFWLDAEIIVKTVPAVLLQHGSR